jgi:hypothetical protein
MIVLGEAHLRWILSDYGRNWIERTTYNLNGNDTANQAEMALGPE